MRNNDDGIGHQGVQKHGPRSELSLPFPSLVVFDQPVLWHQVKPCWNCSAFDQYRTISFARLAFSIDQLMTIQMVVLFRKRQYTGYIHAVTFNQFQVHRNESIRDWTSTYRDQKSTIKRCKWKVKHWTQFVVRDGRVENDLDLTRWCMDLTPDADNGDEDALLPGRPAQLAELPCSKFDPECRI